MDYFKDTPSKNVMLHLMYIPIVFHRNLGFFVDWSDGVEELQVGKIA
jgi:hypothetical protein